MATKKKVLKPKRITKRTSEAFRMVFEVFAGGATRVLPRDTAELPGKEWYWRLKAANGEIVAVSEAYTTLANALHAIEIVRQVNETTKIVLVEEPTPTPAEEMVQLERPQTVAAEPFEPDEGLGGHSPSTY